MIWQICNVQAYAVVRIPDSRPFDDLFLYDCTVRPLLLFDFRLGQSPVVPSNQSCGIATW